MSAEGGRRAFSENFHHSLFAFLAWRIDIHLHRPQKATELLKRHDYKDRIKRYAGVKNITSHFEVKTGYKSRDIYKCSYLQIVSGLTCASVPWCWIWLPAESPVYFVPVVTSHWAAAAGSSAPADWCSDFEIGCGPTTAPRSTPPPLLLSLFPPPPHRLWSSRSPHTAIFFKANELLVGHEYIVMFNSVSELIYLQALH